MNRKIFQLLCCLVFGVILHQQINAQSYQVITNNAFQTNSGSAPQGHQRWCRTVFLVTPAEMATAAVPSGQVLNMIKLNQNVAANPGASGTVQIYLENTSNTATTKSSNWATAITGMTQVATNLPLTLPSAAGIYQLNFNTSTFTYTGGGLYVALEYSNVAGALSATTAHLVNTVLTNAAHRIQTTATVAPTTMAATASRPDLVIGQSYSNDVSVTNVYTLGKMPIEYGAPTVIQANVKNTGLVTMTNISVGLNITGNNSFTDNVVVPSLASGASTIVSFANYSPSNLSLGDLVTVTATTPGDLDPSNDVKTWSMDITPNLYSYKNPVLPNTGGVGFNGATGDFVAKFNSNIGQNPPYNVFNPEINEIKVDLTTAGQTYQIGIWNAAGINNTPGANLWTSPILTSSVGTSFIPVPNVSVSGDYYVGVRQIGTVNIGFAYQAENPIRPGTFFYTSPTGATTWTDFAVTNSAFRFSIEVQVRIPVPPNCAANLFPLNNSSVTCVSPILSWQSGGGAPTGYDVYFSSNSADVLAQAPAALVSANQAGTTYSPGTLSPNTTYYWNIIPRNLDGGAIGCSMQSFTTGSLNACYCIPTYTGTLCIASITQVDLNTLSNSSACSPTAHSVYPPTGALTTSLAQSSTYNLSVTTNDSSIISVWIDYDQNGILDVSEWVQVALAASPNTVSTVGISIPPTAILGNTLMRIRTRLANNVNGALDACTSFGSGESEDYVVNIVPPIPCSGTPIPGNTIASATTVCPGTTVNFSLQIPTNGVGVSYQWFNNGGSISGATNNIYSHVITAADDFYCEVTCGLNTGTSNLVSVALSPAYNCVCASSATNIADEEIFNVTFAGNSTNPLYAYPNGCSIAAPGPGSVLNLYSNFLTLGSLASVSQGDNVAFNIEEGECDGAAYFPFGTAIWIDYNQNGVFDTTEKVFVENVTAVGPRNVIGTINIPANALTGLTIMRIIVAEGLAGASLTPCLSYGYGETEDYLITINPGIPCLGQPTPGNTIASASSFCGSGSVNLSLQNPPTGFTGISYQWYEDANPIVGATNSTHSSGTITSTHSYYCAVSCNSFPLPGNSNPVVVTINQNPSLSLTSSSAGYCAGGSGVTLNASGSAATYSWSPASGLSATTGASVTASPTQSTSYIVTATDINNCVSTATTNVNVYALPTVSTSATPTTVCAGDSVQFTTIASSLVLDSLISTYSGGNGSSGNVFDITATNTITITGFKMMIGTGTTAEVWYKVGGYGNANLTSSAGWTQLGTTVAITPAAPAPTDIPITNTLTIPAGQTYGVVVVCNGSATYTNGTVVGGIASSNADATITVGHGGSGVGGAFNFTFSPRIWNGQFTYEKGSAISNYSWTPAGNMSNASIANPMAASNTTTNYQVTVTDANGCTATDTELITVNACNTTINLTCFIEGYWDGVNQMKPVLLLQGEPTSVGACDSIDVELHSDTSPFGLEYSVRTVLQQNGTATCIFPPVSGNKYIVVKHRNAVQTWSAMPVTMGASLNYNFSDFATKAYGNNMVQVSNSPTIWALFSGDLIVDENIDLLDLSTLESDISNFAFGYLSTDVNGDGNVDLLDSPILESNINGFIFSNHP